MSVREKSKIHTWITSMTLLQLHQRQLMFQPIRRKSDSRDTSNAVLLSRLGVLSFLLYCAVSTCLARGEMAPSNSDSPPTLGNRLTRVVKQLSKDEFKCWSIETTIKSKTATTNILCHNHTTRVLPRDRQQQPANDLSWIRRDVLVMTIWKSWTYCNIPYGYLIRNVGACGGPIPQPWPYGMPIPWKHCLRGIMPAIWAPLRQNESIATKKAFEKANAFPNR